MGLLTRLAEAWSDGKEAHEDLQAELALVPGRGLICPDCGIDLPTGWHWDNCTYDPRTCVFGLEWEKVWAMPIDW